MSSEPYPHHAALVQLGRHLRDCGYRFTAVTPSTHAQILARASLAADAARDVLGWNRAFAAERVPPPLFELLQAAGALERLADDRWRATLRCATVDQALFFHSAFPTSERDAVFFGPDSYRFVQALSQAIEGAERVVDLGCGSGVGGIVLALARKVQGELLLTDVNARALALARVNAELNGVSARVQQSDVLLQVEGDVDLVIANPPYLSDPEQRLYRDGGGAFGGALSVRIVREAGARLTPRAGRLVLYSGAAIVDGEDQLLRQLAPVLREGNARFDYRELDPDIFGSELESPPYRHVERIAAVLLDARFGPAPL
jgi:methylase of polypeptide subunit release factors